MDRHLRSRASSSNRPDLRCRLFEHDRRANGLRGLSGGQRVRPLDRFSRWPSGILTTFEVDVIVDSGLVPIDLVPRGAGGDRLVSGVAGEARAEEVTSGWGPAKGGLVRGRCSSCLHWWRWWRPPGSFGSVQQPYGSSAGVHGRSPGGRFSLRALVTRTASGDAFIDMDPPAQQPLTCRRLCRLLSLQVRSTHWRIR
jgi:hypothetical protein